MKSENGITLISVIITIIVLAILVGLTITNGIQTYEETNIVKFDTYMQAIQKKVDIMLEENIDYTTIGSALTATQKTNLSTIMPSINTESQALRYFSSSDIETVFDIIEVKDDIVVDFANRTVISLNGIEKDGTIYYTEDT